MNRSTLLFAALGAALASMSAPSLALPAASPLGVWIDHSGRGAVEIKPCGASVCGFVVAVKNSSDTKGCGKQIIGGATPSAGNIWGGGWIYSPERRKTYDVELKPLDDGTLRVLGYAGIKMFSRTMIWKRAPADLKLCGSETLTAAAVPAKPSAPIADAEASTTADPAPQAQSAPAAATAAAPAVTPPAPAENPAPDVIGDTATPAKDGAQAEPSDAAPDNAETADANAATDAGPPTPRETGLNLGGLNLEKILTKTSDGKCKIDLPWVKLTVDCNTD